MEAVIPTRGVRHAHIRITTEHPTEFVDLTDRIRHLSRSLAFDLASSTSRACTPPPQSW